MNELSHLPLDKMAVRFRKQYFQMHFREWICCILIKILLKFVRKGLIDKTLALDQIIAWHWGQDIIWTNAELIHWRIYAALREGELRPIV